jgi:putative FmdB family regulatory protein
MPTYDYRCKQCGHEFERVERLSEHAGSHRCPKRGSDQVEHVMTHFYADTSRKS